MARPPQWPLVSSPARRRQVEKNRTTGLCGQKKEKRRVPKLQFNRPHRSSERGRALEYPPGSAARALEASPHSTHSYSNSANQSFTASVLEAMRRGQRFSAMHCEHARAYSNLRVRLHRSLKCARSRTSTLKLRARAQWDFEHAHSDNDAVWAYIWSCVWCAEWACLVRTPDAHYAANSRVGAQGTWGGLHQKCDRHITCAWKCAPGIGGVAAHCGHGRIPQQPGRHQSPRRVWGLGF